MKIQCFLLLRSPLYIGFLQLPPSGLVYFPCRRKVTFQCVIKRVIRGRNAEQRNIGMAVQEDSCLTVTRIRAMYINGAKRLSFCNCVISTHRSQRTSLGCRDLRHPFSNCNAQKGRNIPPLRFTTQSEDHISQYQIASVARKEFT